MRRALTGSGRLAATAIFGLVAATFAAAQESASFRLVEHVSNAGGRPQDGTVAASAGFAVSLDALGDRVTPGLLAGGSFTLGGGFVTPYPPPGEVETLGFTDSTTLVWTPEPTIGSYRLYRGVLSDLPALGYGSCLQSAIAGTTTTDGDLPPSGTGWFYLVTATNLIDEEGTKGFASSGLERQNAAPCP